MNITPELHTYSISRGIKVKYILSTLEEFNAEFGLEKVLTILDSYNY